MGLHITLGTRLPSGVLDNPGVDAEPPAARGRNRAPATASTLNPYINPSYALKPTEIMKPEALMACPVSDLDGGIYCHKRKRI